MISVNLINKESLNDFFTTWGSFACLCYNTNKDKAEQVGKHCFKSGHYSGSRAMSFIFEVEGISRACSHQLVRHSVGVTINQRSQRYCNEENFEYIIPNSIESKGDTLVKYMDLMKEISDLYKDLLDKGIPPEDARYILPNSCETKLTIGFTLEALIHFMNERLCSRSQWEIRELAKCMKKEVVEVLPELEEVLNAKCDNLGYCIESVSCGKRKTKSEVIGKK